jgi:lysylphosphatidylglycerol synthetase-like protein (DUF2156 family)
MRHSEMENRPKAIPVVAAFLFAATAIAAIVGVSLLFPNALLDQLWELNRPGEALFRALGRISGVFLLALGAGMCAAGVGLLRRKTWAWWFAIVLFTLECGGNVVSFFVTGDAAKSVAGMLVSGAFLYVLSRRSVRQHFSLG